RAVMERAGEPPVMVELLRLELVHRKHDRKAPPPEREERADERDVTEDPGLVLDEHDVGLLARDELQLAVEIGRVEVPYAHEGDLVAALAEPVGYGERVVVDPAALI